MDTKTSSVFLTNVLFLAGKLVDANALANTKENIFYSAYLKDRVQYNYVDADKIIDTDAVADDNRVIELEDVFENAPTADNV